MTTIIYIKAGCRKTVSYTNLNKEAAIKEFKKEYGNLKILFVQ